jgi:hypothetical protein
MRLDDASGFVSHLKELTSRSSRIDLLHIVPVLEASVYALREEFLEARRVLLQLPAFHSDALSVTLLRYLNWKLNEPGDPTAPDTVDYLAAPEVLNLGKFDILVRAHAPTYEFVEHLLPGGAPSIYRFNRWLPSKNIGYRDISISPSLLIARLVTFTTNSRRFS